MSDTIQLKMYGLDFEATVDYDPGDKRIGQTDTPPELETLEVLELTYLGEEPLYADFLLESELAGDIQEFVLAACRAELT